ncbi:probable sodium/potassium/calcium exchanger CG1090 isoform X2 [Agrilus planipennis]|nr:probable sodium/potassium/calcium exchanger CG1090 isoform X2 [Agrilus planipennis]
MAAGSSAPELATVIIGVFLAQDDIGISGVIGSAVFNIMFVISVCALSTGTVCYLNWWPLVRDCTFYALSILIMFVVIYDDTISWDESLFMLIMYGVYCIALHYNPQMEKWAHSLPIPFKLPTPEEGSGLVNYKTMDDDKKIPNYGSNPDQNYDTTVKTAEQVTEFDGTQGQELNQFQEQPPPEQIPPPQQLQQPERQNPQYYKPKDHSDYIDPLQRPEDPTWYAQTKWIIVYPIHYMCKKTMPDCRTEQYKSWYPFTFVISMVWISFYSYFMVWMITIIGSTLGIPDTVMGLTFVAAGVSVPDALSSIAVIKEGYGDMAVSNAVGSNVFDILVCLGLPWFIQTAIISPGSRVNVISKGLNYSTFSLLSTVIFLVVATHLNGWKLDRKYGIILMIWYLLFISFASLYELNVFASWNPEACETYY